MQEKNDNIIIFIIVTTIIILLLAVFVVSLIYLYQKKQIAYLKNLDTLKHDHEKNLLGAQLEMQEATFQNISREIHDNISLSLTLAKLQLNTFNWNNKKQSEEKITTSIELLSQSISDLSDISKGLNADSIRQHGLIKVVDDEIRRIRQADLFSIENIVTGDPIYMDAKKELIVFRIIQEAFNNIIKHAEALHSEMTLHYNEKMLHIIISDNGNGFDTNLGAANGQAGLKNMETRTKMLGGAMSVNSIPGCGTTLSFTFPYE